MNSSEIQEAVDDLCERMMDLGIPKPKAQIQFESYSDPEVCLWGEGVASDGGNLELIEGSTLTELFGNANRHLDKIPPKEDRQKREIANLLAKVIDKGNEYGVEVEFMNPLRETMKKLSENIITDQRAA